MKAKPGPNRSTTRAKWYDYASNGIYFVTIVCQHRKQFFGCVLNGTVSLSKAGILADSLWRQIPEEFPNVELDQFIIMPNHIHGILVLRNQEQEAIDEKSNIRGGVTANKNPMLHTGLPRIIRWFKGRFSYDVKKHLHSFAWQPRYHERIIRSPQELVNTKKYIQTNPHRWQHP